MASSHLIHLVAGLLLTASLASASRFSTECTLPTESMTLVPGANIRGTFDILWSSLFTIFICIWTVQHLNVPEQRNGREQGWRGDLKWAWKTFFIKFKWMVFTLIIPEFLVAKAFAERTVARKSMDEVKILKEVDGGSLSEAEISNWTTAHAFYAEMGGFFIRPYGEGTTDTIVVAAADILALRRKGLLRTLPKITAEHLNDLSNGDMFTKAVAIGQVCWMVVQVVVRAAKGLPITQLEITTCGFAASTFLIYLLWWEKPQAVRSATELPLSTESPEFELLDSFEVRVFGFYELVATIGPNRGLRINESMPNETIADVVGERFFVGCLLGGIMLGGVECAAWYFHFPTNIELWLWRISSLVTVAASPVVCIAFMLEAYFAEILRIPKSDKVPIVVNYIAVALFFVARLFILFETMCSFFHLPPGAFVSTWSSSIPHIA